MKIDTTKLMKISELNGEDEEDTKLLREMLVEAEVYVSSFAWCGKILESFLGIGIGGVVAVFCFKIKPVLIGTPEWLWVVTGDLPPAYIDTDNAPNAACALDAYIGEMQDWIDAATVGRSVEGLMHVNLPPTKDNAQQLRSRLEFLDREVLSKYEHELHRDS